MTRICSTRSRRCRAPRGVHGGERFAESMLATPQVLADIERVSALAPLHNPANLAGIRACLAGLPMVPQAVVFDTALRRP